MTLEFIDNGWGFTDDVEPSKPHTNRTIPNWFKRHLKIRRATLKNRKGQLSGHCGQCDGRYLLYMFPYHNNDSNEFQATGCAGWIMPPDPETHYNFHYVVTGYGSEFDGCVFKISKPLALHDSNNNCCDSCINNNIKNGNFDFLHNYFEKTYNPIFEELNRQLLSEKFEYYEVASIEELNWLEGFTGKDAL
jgi:hypothetical protein